MLRVSDIHAVESEKKKIKKAIYKEIYASFTRKIKHAVEIGHKNVVLSVPAFVFGQPSFDMNKAYTYLKRQLEMGGFSVADVPNYTMYVSWGSSERRAVTRRQAESQEPVEDSPFVSLMNLKKTANRYK